MDKNILLLDRPNIKPFIDLLIVDLFFIMYIFTVDFLKLPTFLYVDFFSLSLMFLFQLFYCQLFLTDLFYFNFLLSTFFWTFLL